jgi:hypothetical protein
VTAGDKATPYWRSVTTPRPLRISSVEPLISADNAVTVLRSPPNPPPSAAHERFRRVKFSHRQQDWAMRPACRLPELLRIFDRT